MIAPCYPSFCGNRLNFGGVELRTMVGGPEGFKITVCGKNRRQALLKLRKEVEKTKEAIG